MEDVGPPPAGGGWKAWFPAALYAGLVFIGSSVPGHAMPTTAIWRVDKLLHATEYSVLGALCAFALVRGPWRPGRAGGAPVGLAVVALAATLATAYGASDELHQAFTPGRTPSGFDLLADSFGALVGATAYAAACRTGILRSDHGHHP